MIDVKCEVCIHELEGPQAGRILEDRILISNHWNHSTMIILTTPSGDTYCMKGSDLCAAVGNAQSTNRHGY
jgi:hypothetical protein